MIVYISKTLLKVTTISAKNVYNQEKLFAIYVFCKPWEKSVISLSELLW